MFDGNAWVPLAAANASGSSQTPPQQQQAATDQNQYGHFGQAVDLSDTYAVAGAPEADSGSIEDAGAVYVYTKTSGVWHQTAKLMAPAPEAHASFGISVATAGNYIVVGEPGRTVSGHPVAGQVYVFVKGIGNAWTLSQTFASPGGAVNGGYFGGTVAISNVMPSRPALAISSVYYNSPGTVFTYQGNFGSFTYIQTVQPADVVANDEFGLKISLDGDNMVVSAPTQSNSYPGSGAVYIYTFGASGGNSMWELQQKLSGSQPQQKFGESVSLLNNRVAIGTPLFDSTYKAYVYLYTRTGTTWTYSQALFPNFQSGFDYKNVFGFSLSLDSTALLIGAPADIGGYYFYKPCYALLYKLNTNTGAYYLNTVINDGEQAVSTSLHTSFGYSVALKHGNYIIGAPNKTVNGIDFVGSVAFGFVE